MTFPRGRRGRSVDLTTAVGSIVLPNPVMTASGTAGHGTELGAHMRLDRLGAVVVKSLAAFAWPGNPPPRLYPTAAGMLNSVGLQGPGVEAWRRDHLPDLVAAGARVIVSIWGRTVEEYRRAAELLAELPPAVLALEVNLSCPNLDGGRHLFAHDERTVEEVMAATAGCGLPRWAKLSPNVPDITPFAAAAERGGAEAVTLVNTLLGMAVDPASGQYRLGNGGGGLSGPAIHPIAVRAVHEVRRTCPDLPIVGVGGIASGADAAEMLVVGAQAVQVGTATFADPRAPERVLAELERWCARQGIADLASLASTPKPS